MITAREAHRQTWTNFTTDELALIKEVILAAIKETQFSVEYEFTTEDSAKQATIIRELRLLGYSISTTEEPNKILISWQGHGLIPRDEVCNFIGRTIFVETNGYPEIEEIILVRAINFFGNSGFQGDNFVAYFLMNYNCTFRFWTNIPSNEDRDATPWRG